MITRFFLNYRRKLVKATLSNHPFLKSEWINVREKVLIGNREKFSLVITEKTKSRRHDNTFEHKRI